MRLTKKLAEWRRENVIDDATAEKITRYEQQHTKPMVLWAFGGMGVFAVIVGLVSIIAANWLQTPDWLKLAVALLLCLLLAAALYYLCTRQYIEGGASWLENLWLREMLVLLYYGLVLATMALIGQIYQLGGSIAELLLAWTLVTVPLVFLARGWLIAVLWVIATAVTFVLNMEVLYRFIRHQLAVDSQLLEALFVSVYVLLPLFFILVSRLPWMRRKRPQFSGVISRFSWLAIIAAGFMFQFLWYEHFPVLNSLDIVMICSAAVLIMVYFIPRLYATEHADVHLAMRLVLVSVLLLGVGGLWHHGNLELIGALTNLLYLCILAWAAIKVKSIPLFNLVTAAICLRILVIYFEVFGSMMETGLGLVVGGILTLLIAWWWFKRSNRLALRLTEAEGAPS